MLLTQWSQVRLSAFLKIYIGVAEIYRYRWLEESGQRLENVDSTHLDVASGYKQVKMAKEPNTASLSH